MSISKKEYVLCPECKGNGYFNPNNTSCGGVPDGWVPDPAAPKDKETSLNLCKYCEGTGHVGWKQTFEGSHGDRDE
tara:strand:+ start:1494 stop:1721 length:228 start_codon:yes stop_codon:yes gene_type:complete